MSGNSSIDSTEVYDILEGDPTLPLDDLLEEAIEQKNRRRIEAKQANAKGQDEKAKTLNEAVIDIKDAIEWIEKNHPDSGLPTVSVEFEPTSPTVKSPVSVSVTVEREPEQGVTVQIEDGEKTTTDSEGRGELTFHSAGKTNVQVGSLPEYAPTVAQIEVVPRSVSLQITETPNTFELGESDRVRVTDENKEGIQDVAIVWRDETLGRTDADGFTDIEFNELGTQTIRATAEDTADATFTADTAQLTVTERTVPLSIQVKKDSIEVEEPLGLRVIDESNDPVEEAIISCTDSGPQGTTDEDGEVTLRFSEPRSYELTATKESHREGVMFLDERIVITVKKGSDQLRIVETEGEFVEGKEVKLRVENSYDRPVQNVEVSTNHGHDLLTDERGWTTLDLYESGEIEITARKDIDRIDYESITQTYTINEYKPALSFEDVPQVATPGETFEVRVIDENGDGVPDAVVRSSRQPDTWKTDEAGKTTVQLMSGLGAETLSADIRGVTAREQAEHRILLSE